MENILVIIDLDILTNTEDKQYDLQKLGIVDTELLNIPFKTGACLFVKRLQKYSAVVIVSTHNEKFVYPIAKDILELDVDGYHQNVFCIMDKKDTTQLIEKVNSFAVSFDPYFPMLTIKDDLPNIYFIGVDNDDLVLAQQIGCSCFILSTEFQIIETGSGGRTVGTYGSFNDLLAYFQKSL